MSANKRSQPDEPNLSRREFVATSLAAVVGVATGSASAQSLQITERNVEVKTPDGVCDAWFIHPSKGSHAGVLIWHDSLGVRPAMIELGKRIASEGYSALLPNLFYRAARAPVFDSSFDFAKNQSDREKYGRIVSSLLEPGAANRDAIAYVKFLDEQRIVNKKRKIGTHGYCLGGQFVLRTAALVPDRIGVGVSFHGGFLATAKTDSPHLLAPQIKARLYFAIASDDDRREPEVKDKLKEAFKRAEIEVYPHALHGWCVPDSRNAYNKVDADRAWAKLVSLYKKL